MAFWAPTTAAQFPFPTNHNPSPAPAPPSARDILHQELQNERIREEYISREIAHSRLLLEQQLRHHRELDYPIHRHPSVYPLSDHVQRLTPSYTSFRHADSVVARYASPVTPLLDDRGMINKPRNEGQLPKKISGIKRKAGTIEAANDPVQQDKTWSCTLCQVKIGSEHGLKAHVQGKKHKAMEESKNVVDRVLPADGLKEVNISMPLMRKEQKSIFNCDVCKVKCKSHSNLKSHLNGKRHREESLTALAKAIANSMGAGTSREVDKLPSSVVKDQKAAAQWNPIVQHESKQKAAVRLNPGVQQEKAVQQQTVQSKQVVLEQKPTGQQKQCFNCDVCTLKCNSLIMLNSHLNGKKHKAQLEEHNKVRDGVPITADQVDTKLANAKPATTGQSFYCELCKLKCNSLSDMKSHLNGRRHKEETSREVDKMPTLVLKDQPPAVQQKLAIQQKSTIKQNAVIQRKQVVQQRESFNCDVCTLKCNSLTMLNSHLNGKKHEAQLEERKKAQDGMPITAEVDVKLVIDKPATTVQSFYCDVCKVKCYSELTLNSHLNGKKHKAQFKELNTAVSKPDTAEEHKPIIPVEDMNLANDKPVPAEQSVMDSHVIIEVPGKEESLI